MKKISIILAFITLTLSVYSQTRLKSYEEYIKKYSDIAIKDQKRYGIPASITMAQALIESGAGMSELARKSNNHFGIKCHGWKGKTYKYFDDGKKSCFRRYKKPEDSFNDHSKFLRNGARYRFLFDIDVNNYKSWAKGLKKAGYATDPKYARKLIKVIEDYDLDKLAKGKYSTIKSTKKEKKKKHKGFSIFKRIKRSSQKAEKNKELKKSYDFSTIIKDTRDKEIISPEQNHKTEHSKNGIPYIITVYGDSYSSISKETGISKKRLMKYNDSDNGDGLISPGSIVYTDKKRTWWEGENPFHTVKKGETMRSISQKYAIRLKNLLEYNDMSKNDIIYPGQKIKLRNPEKMNEIIKAINTAVNKKDSIKTK